MTERYTRTGYNEYIHNLKVDKITGFNNEFTNIFDKNDNINGTFHKKVDEDIEIAEVVNGTLKNSTVGFLNYSFGFVFQQAIELLQDDYSTTVISDVQLHDGGIGFEEEVDYFDESFNKKTKLESTFHSSQITVNGTRLYRKDKPVKIHYRSNGVNKVSKSPWKIVSYTFSEDLVNIEYQLMAEKDEDYIHFDRGTLEQIQMEGYPLSRDDNCNIEQFWITYTVKDGPHAQFSQLLVKCAMDKPLKLLITILTSWAGFIAKRCFQRYSATSTNQATNIPMVFSAVDPALVPSQIPEWVTALESFEVTTQRFENLNLEKNATFKARLFKYIMTVQKNIPYLINANNFYTDENYHLISDDIYFQNIDYDAKQCFTDEPFICEFPAGREQEKQYCYVDFGREGTVIPPGTYKTVEFSEGETMSIALVIDKIYPEPHTLFKSECLISKFYTNSSTIRSDSRGRASYNTVQRQNQQYLPENINSLFNIMTNIQIENPWYYLNKHKVNHGFEETVYLPSIAAKHSELERDDNIIECLDKLHLSKGGTVETIKIQDPYDLVNKDYVENQVKSDGIIVQNPWPVGVWGARNLIFPLVCYWRDKNNTDTSSFTDIQINGEFHIIRTGGYPSDTVFDIHFNMDYTPDIPHSLDYKIKQVKCSDERLDQIDLISFEKEIDGKIEQWIGFHVHYGGLDVGYVKLTGQTNVNLDDSLQVIEDEVGITNISILPWQKDGEIETFQTDVKINGGLQANGEIQLKGSHGGQFRIQENVGSHNATHIMGGVITHSDDDRNSDYISTRMYFASDNVSLHTSKGVYAISSQNVYPFKFSCPVDIQKISNDVTISGNLNVTDYIHTDGNLETDGNLTVDGFSMFGNNVDLFGNLTVHREAKCATVPTLDNHLVNLKYFKDYTPFINRYYYDISNRDEDLTTISCTLPNPAKKSNSYYVFIDTNYESLTGSHYTPKSNIWNPDEFDVSITNVFIDFFSPDESNQSRIIHEIDGYKLLIKPTFDHKHLLCFREIGSHGDNQLKWLLFDMICHRI